MARGNRLLSIAAGRPLISRRARPTLMAMRNIIPPVVLLLALTAAVMAANYPVSGDWGQSNSSEKGPIDCSGLRVISFNGNQRTGSNGGVPGYRLKSIAAEGTSSHRIIDEFTSGQIRNGTASYTLRQIDADHIEMNLQQGGSLKLQWCK
jgi:hypothetical protein